MALDPNYLQSLPNSLINIAELSGTVYQKANGAWAEIDAADITGTDYPIEEV